MAQTGTDAFRGRREAVVIVTPAAHNLPAPKRLQEADRWLRERGWGVEWLETKEPREATGLAGRAAGGGGAAGVGGRRRRHAQRGGQRPGRERDGPGDDPGGDGEYLGQGDGSAQKAPGSGEAGAGGGAAA